MKRFYSKYICLIFRISPFQLKKENCSLLCPHLTLTLVPGSPFLSPLWFQYYGSIKQANSVHTCALVMPTGSIIPSPEGRQSVCAVCLRFYHLQHLVSLRKQLSPMCISGSPCWVWPRNKHAAPTSSMALLCYYL